MLLVLETFDAWAGVGAEAAAGAGAAAGVAAGAVDVVAALAVVAGADASAVNHSCTPLWPRHAPAFFCSIGVTAVFALPG